MEAPPASSVAPAARPRPPSLRPPASSVAPAARPRPPSLRPPASSVAPAAPPASSLPPPAPAVASVTQAVGVKRRRAGQHIVLPQPASAVASVAPAATTPKMRKKPSLGPKGAAASKVKKTTSRKKPTPAPAAPSPTPPPVVHEVLDGMPAPPTSFMGLLEEAEVDIGAPPLEPFGFGDDLQEEDDEEEEGEDEEEVTEIEEEAFAAVAKPTVRSTNYSEDEDILLWKLRAQETAPKKSAMLRMDDSEEEGRNEHKPARNKKDKLRKKMEGEASSIREKIKDMMKSREALTMKILETKLLINEKKKEVKLAQVEARREDSKRKADLEERMMKVKEAKA
ncbi:glutathione S-transferase T3-like [Hordeum vulgare]|nr:glutathione S-transferase T3-like [Hordeum vulgare]